MFCSGGLDVAAGRHGGLTSKVIPVSRFEILQRPAMAARFGERPKQRPAHRRTPVHPARRVEGAAHGVRVGWPLTAAVVVLRGVRAWRSSWIWSNTGAPELRKGVGWLVQVASGPNSR
jgi:hypothetical protein